MNSNATQNAPTKKKSKKFLRIVIIVFALCIIAGVIEFARHPDVYLNPDDEQNEVAQTPEPSTYPSDKSSQEQSDEHLYGGYWENNPLDAINLSDEEKRNLYDDLDAAFQKAYETEIAPDASADEAGAVEDDCIAEIAEKYGVSNEDAENIYLYASLGYLYDIDPNCIKAEFGETESVNIVGTTMIIKVKVNPSLNDKMTVDQNFFNVEDIVLNQYGYLFHKISYFAVGDMSDGQTLKIISFDVNKDTIQGIFDQRIVAIQMKDYVTDLWIDQNFR